MNNKRPIPFGSTPPPMLKADGHLSDDWLLLSIDGELSASDYTRVKEHVRACWTCRARREQLERAIEEIVEYEHALVAPDMPPSPGGKAIFLARLDQLSGTLGQPSFRRRWVIALLQACRSILSSRVAWAASAALTITVLFYLAMGRHTPVVSANELLQRAASSGTRSRPGVNRPIAVQRVSIKMRGRKITRTLYRDTVRKRQAYRADVSSSEERAVKQDFDRSSFSWNDPLSPQAYSHWRDGIAEKQDVVTNLEGGLLRLDTSARSGPVEEASLTVRADDYHPVSEELRLRDSTQVEVAELSYDVVGLSTLNADIFGAVAPPEPLRLPTASSPATVHTALPDAAQIALWELQVRSALRSIGADLGEQIVVRQDPKGLIQVDGVAEDEARKRKIVDVLIGIPHTRVGVMTIAEVAAHPQSTQSTTIPNRAPIAVVSANPPLLEEQLKRRFSDSDQLTQYVNLSLSLCQSASARAWALNRLADRYTPQQIALLDSNAQRQLQSLLIDHVTALREDVSRLQNQLGQVLSSASNTAAANTASSPASTAESDDWRGGTHRVHSSVEITNEAVSVLLAGSSEASDSPDKLQLRLRTTLTQLQAELQLLDQQIHKQL